jgi:hypothetical protein
MDRRSISAEGTRTAVNVTGLREARRSWSELEQCAARSRGLLSLEEVRASDRPAFFFDHGEHLLYVDGQLFDLREADAAWPPDSHPLPLPHAILESGVGIEFGWRHATDCRCSFCAQPAAPAAPTAAVA